MVAHLIGWPPCRPSAAVRLHGYEGPLYVFMGTTGRATGKFEHRTCGCNVYCSICCFLLVIYLHLHSSGSFSPGRHNLAPTLMELDFKKNNHVRGRRGDSSKNPWLDNCPACSVHQTCRWVGTTCGAMVAVRILNGDAMCSDRTHRSSHLSGKLQPFTKISDIARVHPSGRPAWIHTCPCQRHNKTHELLNLHI
jgi:hypothetical protein